MPSYRLFHFRGAHIQRADEIVAADDLAAIKKAEALVEQGQLGELWRGPRKLKTFNPL